MFCKKKKKKTGGDVLAAILANSLRGVKSDTMNESGEVHSRKQPGACGALEA